MAAPSVTLLNRVIAAHGTLDLLAKDLYRVGASDVADAVKRARRELEHPSITGPANQVGVNSRAIRP